VETNATELKELQKAVKDAMASLKEHCEKAVETADAAMKTAKEYGTIHGEQNEQLKKMGEQGTQFSASLKAATDRLTEVEQKLSARNAPQSDDKHRKSIGEIIAESEEYKAVQALGIGARAMHPVNIGSFHKAAILNTTQSITENVLVDSQRVGGIIVPAQRRLTIRDLIPQATTTSNLIEFASEASFTSAAAPQGSGSSPAETEGQLKAEASMTFTLANSPVITVAHWIPASRQVLSDASMLSGHVSARLIYGLKLEEEDELLNGTGAAGTLDGLINQSTPFNAGSTNLTAIDCLLKAFTQVSLSNYEASAVVLHPIDWQDIILAKDTQGRYLFADPQNMVDARIWAKPVVPTQAIARGKFLTGAFNLAAQIWDREDATVRISENVNDHFIRNMVAILAEERLALTVYRSAAMVYGDVSHAG
jgi:HK97 family phage major capsid protein